MKILKALKTEQGRILAIIVLFFLLQLLLSARISINWDEFHFLERVYSFNASALETPLQTFYVRLLAWLPYLPGSEVDHVVVGRFFMTLCEALALGCVYLIARRFTDSRHSLYAILAWAAANFALVHGASFRADALAAALIMSSLAILFAPRLKPPLVAAAGILAALAILVTLKALFYLPAFFAALVWHWDQTDDAYDNRCERMIGFGVAGGAMIVTFTTLMLYHISAVEGMTLRVATSTEASAVQASTGNGTTVGEALKTAILSQPLLPRRFEIAKWVVGSLVSLFLCILGMGCAVRALRDGKRFLGLAIIALALPMASLLFYRNAFPYFFPFIMLPFAVTAAIGASLVRNQRHRMLLTSAMMALILAAFFLNWKREQTAQRLVVDTVHEIFPEPVRYIGGYGMIASFPRVNFFMSSWGVGKYRAGDAPNFADTIRTYQPPLLLRDSRRMALMEEPNFDKSHSFFVPGDIDALRANYIEHWGPVAVAGKDLRAASGTFELQISGPYTVECAGSRTLDGALIDCGTVIELAPGNHSWGRGPVTLRWGDHLKRPPQAALPSLLYDPL